MTKERELSEYEIKTGHRDTPCVHEQRGEVCYGDDFSCVLFTCSICGCSEGELASECPGYRLPEHAKVAIFEARNADFKDGKFVGDYPRCPFCTEGTTYECEWVDGKRGKILDSYKCLECGGTGIRDNKIFTCNECPDKGTCPDAWDLYNTNGDCLASK